MTDEPPDAGCVSEFPSEAVNLTKGPMFTVINSGQLLTLTVKCN